MISLGAFSMDPMNVQRHLTRRSRSNSGEIYGNTVGKDYIPVFVGNDVKSKIGKDSLYYLEKNNEYSSINSYDSLFGMLNNTYGKGVYHFNYKEETGTISVSRGVMFDESGEILYLLTVRKGVVKGEEKPEDLKAYVSNNLISKAKYTNIYRKFLKDYFTPMMEGGVKFYYTPENLIDLFFERTVGVSFKNLEEMKNLFDEAKNILNYNYNIELLHKGVQYGLCELNGDTTVPSETFVPPHLLELYKALAEEYYCISYQYETEVPSYFYDIFEEEEDVDFNEVTGGCDWTDQDMSVTSTDSAPEYTVSGDTTSRITIVDDTEDSAEGELPDLPF